tara:strand:- start:1426 stop:3621 length:2196 start_codon:yes stop_codon:yes gene_type:complete
MFKVHLPSKTYIRKTLPSVSLKRMLSFVNPTLQKSASMMYTHRDLYDKEWNWNPSDEGLSDDHDTHDHPPWNHNPDGSLRYKEGPDGKVMVGEDGKPIPEGMHPIDYIHYDLINTHKLNPDDAKNHIQSAIDLFNKRLPPNSNHYLPDFDSPLHRKVFSAPLGSYDYHADSNVRKTRGHAKGDMPAPLVTYFTNDGNVKLPGATTGTWLDSGAVHFNRELGEVLRGNGINTKGMNYVNHNRLLAGDLSFGVVRSQNRQEHQNMLETGHLPKYARPDHVQDTINQGSQYEEAHPHQILELFPDNMFRSSTRNQGGRPSKDPDKKKAWQSFAEDLQEIGMGDKYSEDEIKDIASTRAIRTLYGDVTNLNQGEEGTGGQASAKGAINQFMSALGVDHRHPHYNAHLENLQSSKGSSNLFPRAKQTTERILARYKSAISQRMEDGMSEEEAIEDVVNTSRNFQATDGKGNPIYHRDFNPTVREGKRSSIDHRDAIMEFVNAKAEHYGAPPSYTFANILDEEGRKATEDRLEPMKPTYAAHHEPPEHWQRRTVMNPQDELAPSIGDYTPPPSRFEQVPPMIDLPPPQPQVPMTPYMRQPRPDERAFADLGIGPHAFNPTAPTTRQTMFDPYAEQGDPFLVRTSNDVMSGLSDILKKMEEVQVLDALQDNSVRKLLPTKKVSIDSFWDVQSVAKSLGITSVDVHGLYQSTGDWHKVADQWNVKPDVVKAVKVAFGGM